mgnify:CR=1 FL=1
MNLYSHQSQNSKRRLNCPKLNLNHPHLLNKPPNRNYRHKIIHNRHNVTARSNQLNGSQQSEYKFHKHPPANLSREVHLATKNLSS